MAAKENYQINGSFEYASNPDIPDYWTGMGRWTRSNVGIPKNYLTEKGIKDFIKKFYLDDRVAYDGKRSLRVESPFFVSSTSMFVSAKKDYVISVYLKSSRENMQVDLSAVYTDREKPYRTTRIAVSKDWKRYQIALPGYPYNKVSMMVKPLDVGKLWVDAVQIEDGLQASPFKPSHFDAGFTKSQPPIHLGIGNKINTPSVSIPAPVKTPPVIDGTLEDVWNDAVCLNMKTMMGSPCETPTRIKLLYDNKNIYAAFDCKDPRGTNGKDESIEIFMDLLGIGSPFYQFIFTPEGKKYNYRNLEGKHEWDWKADWKVATKKNPKGGWTAEVMIPFSVMPESKEVCDNRLPAHEFLPETMPAARKYICHGLRLSGLFSSRKTSAPYTLPGQKRKNCLSRMKNSSPQTRPIIVLTSHSSSKIIPINRKKRSCC